MADLFAEVEDPRARKNLTPEADGPVMVSDAGHIERLVKEVCKDLCATPEELAEWAGHRTRTNEEAPWIVEQVVGAKLTERRFKMMVAGALHPKQVGSFINGLVNRQYNGAWRVASFQVQPGTTVRMDGERRATERLGGSDDDLSFVGSNVDSDAAPQTKATVRWVVKWIDANGERDIRYTQHGEEIKPLDLSADAMATMGNAGNNGQVMAALAAGQAQTALALNKLADAVTTPAQPAAPPRARPGRKPKPPVE